MANTLEEIQNRISALLDQEQSPTQGDDEWNLRTQYINTAQSEWEQLYDWQVLYTEYNTATTTGSANTSISLPADFRKIASYPKITFDGSTTDEFQQVRPQERSQKLATDKYFWVMGNKTDGYTMVVNPSTSSGNLASGASIFVSYYATANSLVSPADVTPVPDINYLVHKALAQRLFSADDPRYSISQAESEKILARMLEREAVHSEAADDYSRIRTVEETRYGFRIGRN